MSYIITATGGKFYYAEMERSDIRIEDIAAALSKICRFAGHVSTFYSVAQHSVHVSQIVPKDIALAGLLHDASEAYMMDIPTPLKHLIPDYRAIEKRAEREILSRFGISTPLPYSVKVADLTMLATEKRDFIPADSEPWPILSGVAPLPGRLRAWGPEEAEIAFLTRYYDLTGNAQGRLNLFEGRYD